MTILICYCIALGIIILFLVFTSGYKKEITARLDNKKYPLKFLYGTAFFILDHVRNLFRKLFPNRPVQQTTVKKSLEKLYVGEDPDRMEYLFQAKRIAFSYLFLLAILFLGFAFCYNGIQDSKKIKKLSRGNEETSYSLEVKLSEEETQIIDVTLPAKEFDFKESLDLFEKYRKGIVKELLGENPDIEHIQKPLHFISEYGEEGLSLTWEPENELLIDASGQVYPENIESEGAFTSVTTVMTLGEYTTSLTIPLILVP